MNAAYVGLEFIYATLTANSALMALCPGGVNRGTAPPGTAYPFIVMNLQAGSDVLTMNAVRLMTECVYQIKVVGPASTTVALATVDAAMDALIKRTSGSSTDGLTLSFYRDTPIFLDENVSGIQYLNVGGLYRAQIVA